MMQGIIRGLALPLLTALALIGLTGCDSEPTGPFEAPSFSMDGAEAHLAHGASHGNAAARASDQQALAAMREGTARYHRLEVAVADGFIPLSPCVPGMGIHYGRPDRVFNPTVVASEPEVLLYQPTENGRYRLVGVEFMVPADLWYGAENESPPSVAGREFDPPNAAHHDPLVASSYTLHAWVWMNNPDGMFAPFNPRVVCS